MKRDTGLRMERGSTMKEAVDTAQPAQDMDKRACAKSTIFNRHKPDQCERSQHHPVRSRTITCDQKASLHQSYNRFVGLKIEITNDCKVKRKLNDSGPDEGYKTPAKKPFSPAVMSPDLGCFVDCCSPSAGQDSLTNSKPKAQAVTSQITETGSSTARGFFDNVESCKSQSSSTCQSKPVLIHPVAHRQDLERGDGQVEEEREERKKAEMLLDAKDVEEEKGYFSMNYVQDVKGEKDHKQAALCEEHFSFAVSDLFPVVSGPLLDSANSRIEPLEGDVEDVLKIGPPMFESSVCHIEPITDGGSEQSRHASEEAQAGVTEPIRECQTTLEGQESTWPLQVQVKSVVVIPCKHPSSCKPAALPLPKQNASPTRLSTTENQVFQAARNVRSERPEVFGREVDLEREKQIYLRSVNRHLNEKQGGSQDVVDELLNLMTHVADQPPDSNGRQWQHPSDLTRRNYQRRFGNTMPTITLREWQAKNCGTYKRFARVPKIFQRSWIP